MKRYRATKDWQRSFDEALVVTVGQVVSLGKRDNDWTDFYWCQDSAGMGSWLPRQVLRLEGDRAEVTADYNAIELTVHEGDSLSGGQQLAGWIWCRDATGGEGWVPASHLAQV